MIKITFTTRARSKNRFQVIIMGNRDSFAGGYSFMARKFRKLYKIMRPQSIKTQH